MTPEPIERRRYPRTRCEGMVTLRIHSGPHRGSIFASLLHDISERGACVLLDAGEFERATAVSVESMDGTEFRAWVCHYTQAAEYCRLGLSFESVDGSVSETCWEEQLCRLSPVDLATKLERV